MDAARFASPVCGFSPRKVTYTTIFSMAHKVENVGSIALKHQARCVVPHAGHRASHQFITATTSLRDDNELHVVAYDDDRSAALRSRV